MLNPRAKFWFGHPGDPLFDHIKLELRPVQSVFARRTGDQHSDWVFHSNRLETGFEVDAHGTGERDMTGAGTFGLLLSSGNL